MPEAGLSFKQTVETLTNFLEVALHTILYLRGVYPATTFTRRRSHGVPVYQNRHPDVRAYIGDVTQAISKEIESGHAKRVTVVIKTLDDLPLERFIIDFGYMGLQDMMGSRKESSIVNAPTPSELSVMLRGFLIRLTALEGQLQDNTCETTFAIVVETNDDLEPATGGDPSPWTPALAQDTLNPQSAVEGHHEPLLAVKAVETGVIDECVAKTGVEHLDI